MHYYVTETKMVYSARGNLVDPETYYGKFNKDYAEQTSLGSYIEAMMQRWRERNTKEYSEKDDVEYEKAVDSLNSSFISIEGCDQNDLDYLSEFIESGTAELTPRLPYKWTAELKRLIIKDLSDIQKEQRCIQ